MTPQQEQQFVGMIKESIILLQKSMVKINNAKYKFGVSVPMHRKIVSALNHISAAIQALS